MDAPADKGYMRWLNTYLTGGTRTRTSLLGRGISSPLSTRYDVTRIPRIGYEVAVRTIPNISIRNLV